MSALPVLKRLAQRETLRGADRWFIGQRHAMGFMSIELAERLQLPQASAFAASRLLPIPRMNQRITAPKSSAPYWERCADIDLDLHIRERTLPTGSTSSDARKIIEDEMRTPLDSSKRPPWDMTLIQRPGSGTLLLWRVHHSIADAAGLTALLTRYADPDERTVLPQSARPSPSLLTTISRVPRNILDLIRNTVPPEAPQSSIKRAEPATDTALAWLARPPAVSALKQMARELGGGTVNDVIMAAVTGALRKYMLANGDDVEKIPVMSGVAVGGVKPAGQLPLGNHFGFLTVQLPVGVADVAGRYAQMRKTMEPTKTGYRPYLAETSYNLFGYLAAERRNKLLEDGRRREVSCIVTNVSGPRAPLHIGGIPVVGIRMHGALFQTIGVMVAVYSYNGRIDVSFSADKALLNPEVLCKYFEEEIRTLEGIVSSQ